MTNPVMVVRNWIHETDGVVTNHGRGCWVFCPGCKAAHVFDVIGDDGSQPEKACWDWDGNMEAPTFSPSMLAYSSFHRCPPEFEHTYVCPDPQTCGKTGHLVMDGDALGHMKPHIADPAWGNCHSFLRAGRWEFLGDSAHALAGQTVDMVPLPDWLCSDGET